MTLWIEPRPIESSAALEPLALHPLVERSLALRGFNSLDAARAFLYPAHYIPSPAGDLPGVGAATDRIEHAITHHEPICVWGDFDVDGQTATTILVSTLKYLGADVTYHIPVRKYESHGINLPKLKEIIQGGARLILTCDTGIKSHDAVAYALAQQVDMVITDHHDLPETPPPAAAVVNPKYLPAGHPQLSLSGSGVAYKLAEELYERFHRKGETTIHLDLAALGLVADLAILTGETRNLVQRGLETLRSTGRIGLKTIMEFAQVNPAHLNEEHIGFVLAPRLNALGRLGDANSAVEFFTTQDGTRARILATQLEGLNAQRQLLTRQVYEAAEARLQKEPDLLEQPVLILAHPGWPGGVIGIVASRLVERYRRPAILFTTTPGEAARGSARSIAGLDISAAIAAQHDLLLGFGGHPMAAGLSLEPEQLPQFQRALNRMVAEMSKETQEEARLNIDAWLELKDASLELAEILEMLAPFGPGNDKLILATRNVHIRQFAAIGRHSEHLKIQVEDAAGFTQEILWWDGDAGVLEAAAGEAARLNLAYTLRASDFRGTRQATLEYVDLQVITEKAVEVKPRVEVVDFRKAGNPVETLARQREKLDKQPVESFVIWEEGSEKKTATAQNRNGLHPADILIIWTTPPGPAELRTSILRVKPRAVYLFCISPKESSHQAFLTRLAGLVKYAIRQRNGRVNIAELAAVMAQREAAIHAGMEWLRASGQVLMEQEMPGELTLMIGNSARDDDARMQWLETLSYILEETAAYRAYFEQALPEALIP